jgi:hypothetical protein
LPELPSVQYARVARPRIPAARITNFLNQADKEETHVRKSLLISFLTIFLSLAIQPAHADHKLANEEAKSIFTGKTFDGVVVKSSRAYSVYFSPDGSVDVVYADGKTATGTWNINSDGQHCVSMSGCADVIDKGDGVYHKFKNGEHTHVLKNAREGRQL